MDIGNVANNKKQLISEFLDSRRPKNEHEYAAAQEIIRLLLIIEQKNKAIAQKDEALRKIIEIEEDRSPGSSTKVENIASQVLIT